MTSSACSYDYLIHCLTENKKLVKGSAAFYWCVYRINQAYKALLLEF